MNKKKFFFNGKKNTSQYKGVHLREINKKKQKDGSYKIYATQIKYRASIRVERKLICLGNYNTEKEAAIAYDEAARKYFGEFARLNFSNEMPAKNLSELAGILGNQLIML